MCVKDDNGTGEEFSPELKNIDTPRIGLYGAYKIYLFYVNCIEVNQSEAYVSYRSIRYV